VLAAGAAPELLRPPVNLLRLAVHPHGMGCRVENLPEWGRHIIENVRAQALRSPDPRLDELLGELESHVPPMAPGRDHIGFAVPLRLRCDEGELRLMTTLTSRLTAVFRTARKTRSGWAPSTGIDSLIDTTDRVGRRWT
jgi:hypothetical protein